MCFDSKQNKTLRPAANYRQAVCLRLVCPHMANWVEPGEETLFRGCLQDREADTDTLTQFEGLVVKSAEWSGSDEDRQSGDQLSGSVWGLASWDGQGGQTGVEAKGVYHNDWWNSLEIHKGDALVLIQQMMKWLKAGVEITQVLKRGRT